MVVIREMNEITDGFPYAMVRDRIKEYWKNHNGKVLSTKKTKTKDYTYCTYVVRIEYKNKKLWCFNVPKSFIFFTLYTFPLHVIIFLCICQVVLEKIILEKFCEKC